MKKQYCPYCLPTKRKHHLVFHLDYYLRGVLKLLGLERKELQKKQQKTDSLWGLTLELLSLFKIVKFVSNPEEQKLRNRSLIFFKEAKKRGLTIKAARVLGRYTDDFKFAHNGKRHYYESIPLLLRKSPFDIDNKYKVKLFLQENNIPVAEGRAFSKEPPAFRFAEEIGYPLVVKPTSGSLSHHITCEVDSKEKLKEAIRIAKVYCPDFIVERYIEGNLYRATIAARKYVFCCQKERANVVGDGTSTIRELIGAKNSNPKRGKTYQKNTTLHEIPINDRLLVFLRTKGFTLNSILPQGQKIYLSNKFILSSGCDIINCTEAVHPDNKNIFLKTAELLQADLVGIDFIAPDITKSHKEQKTAVLEANSLPYIDMHQYPSDGQPDLVAEIIWDAVLCGLEKGQAKP